MEMGKVYNNDEGEDEDSNKFCLEILTEIFGSGELKKVQKRQVTK